MIDPIRSCVDDALCALSQDFLGSERELVRQLEPIDFESSVLRLRTPQSFPTPSLLQTVQRRLEALLQDRLQVEVVVRILFPRDRSRASAKILEHASNRPLLKLFDMIADGSANRHRIVFVYGAPGVGKSFVVERRLVAQLSSPVVMHRGRQFHEEYVSRARMRSRLQWHQSMIESKVFVLDEVHRLAGKSRTQIELCQILDGLRSRKALAVLIARHHPRKIHKLESALATRLLSGFTHEIKSPPLEVRREFVRSLGVGSRDETTFEDLTRVPRSFGEIERRFERTCGGARDRVGTADAAFARDEFLQQIVARVAEAFACEVGDIRGPRPSRRFSLPRHVVVFAARSAGISGAEMARRLGWNSASSASYAVQRVESKMRDDPEFRRVVQSIL